MPIRIFKSTDRNPWFNLATEDMIFRDMDPSVDVLFLWQNQPNIVIGRHQNPWAECNLPAMEEQGVLLTRRQSGRSRSISSRTNWWSTAGSMRPGCTSE